MNYLVPIDFSDHSKSAAEYAASLTKIWSGNLHLAHIFVPIEEEPEYLSVKTLNVKRNTVFELISYQESLRKAYGVRSSSDLLKGEFVEQIRATASREKSDLIVVGMQGETGLRDFLYGSHTVAVLESSSVPVLVVHKGSNFKPYGHIAFLSTLAPEECEIVQSLLKISKRFNAKLTVLHSGSNEKVESFKAMVQADQGTITFENIRTGRHIAQSLLEYSKQNGVDLLSLTNSDTDLLTTIAGRSLTTEFLFESDVPLLLFPS